jgi:actin-like ATPase involved in cell morphogenesis
VWLVDEPVAAAVGAGLDVVGAEPFLLLDVGAGIVEAVAVREGAVFDAAALQLGATTSAGLLPYALDGVVEMTAALVRRLPDDVRPSVPALTVTGGGARQRRLLHRLQTALRMPVNTLPEPEYATIRGLSRMGRHPELASRISRQGR